MQVKLYLLAAFIQNEKPAESKILFHYKTEYGK